MRINNNITAMNAHRQYGINNNNIGKNVEKLSSGYKINRAGDDAAGLAISEKMRGQIRGLNMASKNSQDAISLVQTAEGALQETHNILQRMRELAVQSSSDTNEQTIDRAALQQEFNQLKKEIDDIASKTRFNDQNLIDGTFQKYTSSMNNFESTLNNVNAISVARAKAGDYQMSVTSTPAGAAVTTEGAQCVINSSDVGSLAMMSDKIKNVSFSGLKTGDHNGNTYTLKVLGDDLDDMKFQLLDSNNKIVATSKTIDATTWSGNGNKVSFDGVGTFTFDLEEDAAISTLKDLTSLSGATLDFLADGRELEATLADTTLTAAVTDINAILGGTGTIANLKFNAGDAFSVFTDESGIPEFSFDYALDKAGNLTVSLLQDGVAIASGKQKIDGLAVGTDYEFDLGDYGTVTFDVATAPITLQEGDFKNTVDYSKIAVTTTDMIDDIKGGLTNGSNLTVAFTAGTGTEELYHDESVTDAKDLFEYSYSLDNAGSLTITVTDKITGKELDSKSASLVLGATGTIDIDLDDYGKFTFTNGATATSGGAGVSGNLSPNTVADSVTSAPVVRSTTGNIDAATPTVTVENTEVTGETPETTDATKASMTLTINGESVTLHKGDTYANFYNQGIAFEFDALSDTDILNSDYFGASTVDISVNTTRGQEMVIQTGANQGDELGINIDRMSTETLGISYSHILTREAASEAITEVNNALNQVSTQRAALGALQNRLDHKISNLDTSAENLQAAESRIRDVDMAKQMTQFMRDQILSQASTAMLAQANALPQGVLQLLG